MRDGVLLRAAPELLRELLLRNNALGEVRELGLVVLAELDQLDVQILQGKGSAGRGARRARGSDA